MKKSIQSAFFAFVVITVLLSACAPASTPILPTPTQVMPASESAPAVRTLIATQEPILPTQEPSPTATPLPVPCTIAFDSDRDGNRDVYLMDSDGNHLVNLTNNPAEDFDPAWSPDGRQIAFVSTRPNESSSQQAIYLMDVSGSNVFQLTTDFYSDWPDWSHDGKQITYTSNEDVHIIQADGSGQPINLTNSPEKDIRPTWSPDGSKIAWLSGHDGSWDVFVMNSDGSNLLNLTNNGRANNVLWTIDGEIFTHWNHPDGVCSNCVMNADGSNARNAGGKGEIQRYLPFRTLNGDRVELGNGPFSTGDEEIFLVGEMYPDIFLNLTNNPAQDRNPDWPANCLAGFAANRPEESVVPATDTTEQKNQIIIVASEENPIEQQNVSDQWEGALFAENLKFSDDFEMKLLMKAVGENTIGLVHTEGTGERWWIGTQRMELSCVDGRLRVALLDGTSEFPVYEKELSMPSSGLETSCEVTVKFDKSAKNIQFFQNNKDILLLTPEKVGDFQEGLFPNGEILKVDLSLPPHADNSNSGAEFSRVKIFELIFFFGPDS